MTMNVRYRGRFPFTRSYWPQLTALICMGLLVSLISRASFAEPGESVRQLAIWTFGGDPTFVSGDELPPTQHAVNGTPALVMTGGEIDSNGKGGRLHQDVDGIDHDASRAAAWDDIKASGPDAELILIIDTTGWYDISFRFDYKSELADGYNLAYSTDEGTSWIPIVGRKPLSAGASWQEAQVDLSQIDALENQAGIQLRLDHLDDDPGNKEFVFDNVEVLGSKNADPTRPSIKVDATTTTYLPLPASGGGSISGVVNDPTDPARTAGIVFLLADPDTAPEDLQIHATSANSAVVPEGNLVWSGAAALRTLTIRPVAAGFTTITVEVSDGNSASSYVIHYAASDPRSGNAFPAGAYFHTGMSDASSALPTSPDSDYIFVANDELISGLDMIYLFDRQNSGARLNQFDFTPRLNLQGKEMDLEASTRVGDTIYWLSSHSNNKDGECRPDRYRFFATTVSGTGATATLDFVGHYDFLRDDLIAWDNTEKKKELDFQFSTACAPTGGIAPKRADGFNIEGLAMAPDSDTTAFIAFRAPLLPIGERTKALIVPLINATSVFSKGQDSSSFGDPILLDLGGRGIRSIERNANNDYLIIAGPPGDTSNPPLAPNDFRLYRWTGIDPAVSGSELDRPTLLRNLSAINPLGSWESIVEMPADLDGGYVQFLTDNGTTDWYGDGKESKDLSASWQKFRSEWLSLPRQNTAPSRIYLPTIQRIVADSLVPAGAEWRYLDNGTDQAAAWRRPAFDDSSWKSGPAELGYGDTQVTEVGFGPDPGNKHITTYFRHAFTVNDPTRFRTLDLRLLRDDGAVVYLNGVEVMRSNMADGDIRFDTRAPVAVGGAEENSFYDQSIPGDRLVLGRNVLAVEIHQANPDSSDISFDLALSAVPVRSWVDLIPTGSPWRYLDNGEDQSTGWRGPDFDDTSWKSGQAELGYGDTQVTEVDFGTDSGNKHITTYFRHAFVVSDPASIRSLDLRLLRDDGAVVYLNGVEVLRSNMADGEIRFNTLAQQAIGGADEETFYFQTIPATHLLPGRNVLAVEIHQVAPTSSDISFDLGLQSRASARFAVIGDYGDNSSNEADVANLVKSWDPDFIVTLGDNNYDLGESSTIDQNIGQYYSDYIFPYSGAFGPGATENRFFPTLGNHDWYTRIGDPPLPQPYLDYFTLPTGPGNERYYDFVHSPVHFFAVDSDKNEPDGTSSSSIQGQWLQKTLQANADQPWKIVLMHHAPYSSSNHGSQAYMQWPYTEWGASMVMAGHDHVYERLWHSGIPYFVNGAGGRSLYDFQSPLEEGSLTQFRGYGAMLIQADSCTMLVHFVAPDGAIKDSSRFSRSTAGCP